MATVLSPEPFRYKNFDGLFQKFLSRVAKQLFCLYIYEDDPPLLIDDYDPIRCGVNQGAEECVPVNREF